MNSRKPIIHAGSMTLYAISPMRERRIVSLEERARAALAVIELIWRK